MDKTILTAVISASASVIVIAASIAYQAWIEKKNGLYHKKQNIEMR